MNDQETIVEKSARCYWNIFLKRAHSFTTGWEDTHVVAVTFRSGERFIYICISIIKIFAENTNVILYTAACFGKNSSSLFLEDVITSEVNQKDIEISENKAPHNDICSSELIGHSSMVRVTYKTQLLCSSLSTFRYCLKLTNLTLLIMSGTRTYPGFCPFIKVL